MTVVPLSPARALLDSLTRLLRILWTTIFSDPARDNHLRLVGLRPAERHAARFGLVLLACGLASVLGSRLWRAGPMNAVEDSDGLLFVPAGTVVVTFVAMMVAWILIGWGALAGRWFLCVLAAVAFVALDAGFATGIPDGGVLGATWPNRLIVAGFWAVPALLLAAAVVSAFPKAWRIALPAFRVLVLLAVLAHFGGYVWMLATDEPLGRSLYEVQLALALGQTDGLLMPLVFVSGIVVVDFGLSVANGVAEGTGDLSLRLLRAVLVVVLAVKLWVEAVQHRQDVWVYVRDRPDATVRTVVMMLLLVVVVRLVTRFAPTDRLDPAKEAILYGSSLAISLAILGLTLVYGVGTLQTVLQGGRDLPGWALAFPALQLSRWANLAFSGVALAAGILLMRRDQPAFRRELGSGLVVLGAWTLPTFVMQLGDYRIGFSPALADLLITVGIAVFAASRWSSLRPRDLVTLLALTLFAWLTMSQGDWLAWLGALLGLSAVVVVVVGISLTVFTDAGFTTGASRLVPHPSRVLWFIGYLVLSVTLLNWSESVHAVSVSSTLGSAPFLLVGIPWAAWLAGRQLVRRPPTSTTPSTTRTS